MNNFNDIVLSLLKNNKDKSIIYLFNLLPIGIELYNSNGILVATNQYNIDLLGFKSKYELFGKNLFYDNRINKDFKEKACESDDFTFWHICDFDKLEGSSKSGTARIFTRFKKLYNDDNELLGYVRVHMDERNSEEKPDNLFAPIIENKYAKMHTRVVRDENNEIKNVIITKIDNAFSMLFGFRSWKVEGKDILAIPIHIPHRMEIAKLNKSNRRFTFLYYIISTNKFVRWTVEYLRKDEHLSYITDITPMMLENSSINYSINFYRMILDKSLMGLVILDKFGRVEDVNKKFLNEMGVEKKVDIIGYKILDGAAEYYDKLKLRLEKEEVITGEFRYNINQSIFKNNNNNFIYARILVYKYYTNSGSLRGYILYIRDISSEKDNVMLLKQKCNEAVESSRIKSQFVQNLSHEIRTPLNAIVGFSQLLSLPDGMLTAEEKKEYSNYVSNSSNMLTMLVDDILNLSDTDNRNYHITLSDVNVNELLNNTIKSIEYRIPSKVECYYKTTVDDNFTIHSDARRVQQVLINFLTNACKHTTEGKIVLSCEVSESANIVHFSVTDTGTGVDPSISDKLFERFVKIGTLEGTGLGLHICRTISQRLGGMVSYDKSYTNGAKFDFELPIHIELGI